MGAITNWEAIPFIAANGVPFNVRLVCEGDRYGLNGTLIHSECLNGPMVEFYDARYMNGDPAGQFVARYYLRTLLASQDKIEGELFGLCLDSAIEAWQIDGATLTAILHGLTAAYDLRQARKNYGIASSGESAPSDADVSEAAGRMPHGSGINSEWGDI